MKLVSILLEGYKDARIKFVDETQDESLVINYLDKFKTLASRNKISGVEKNIDYWHKEGWDRFKQFVDTVVQRTSVKATKTKSKSNDSLNAILLTYNPEWYVYIPLDKNASVQLGKGSDWCTAKSSANHFETYFYTQNITLIYIIPHPRNKTNNKYAITFFDEEPDTYSMFDVNDRNIGKNTISTATGYYADSIIELAMRPDILKKVQTARSYVVDMIHRGQDLVDDLIVQDVPDSIALAELENIIIKTKDVGLANAYIINIKKASVNNRLENVSPIMTRTLISISGSYAKYLGELPESLQKAAVRNDVSRLKYLKNIKTSTIVYVYQLATHSYEVENAIGNLSLSEPQILEVFAQIPESYGVRQLIIESGLFFKNLKVFKTIISQTDGEMANDDIAGLLTAASHHNPEDLTQEHIAIMIDRIFHHDNQVLTGISRLFNILRDVYNWVPSASFQIDLMEKYGEPMAMSLFFKFNKRSKMSERLIRFYEKYLPDIRSIMNP